MTPEQLKRGTEIAARIKVLERMNTDAKNGAYNEIVFTRGNGSDRCHVYAGNTENMEVIRQTIITVNTVELNALNKEFSEL